MMLNKAVRVFVIGCITCLLLTASACKNESTQASSTEPNASLLIYTYRQAHEKRDFDTLDKLYSDEGTPQALRAARFIQEAPYFEMSIVRMRLNTPPKRPLATDSGDEVAASPGLAEVSELEVEFKTAQGEAVTRYYPLAIKQDKYLIIDRVNLK